jgi:hypothetical protein
MMTATKVNNTLQIFILEMCVTVCLYITYKLYINSLSLVQSATLMYVGITGHVCYKLSSI